MKIKKAHYYIIGLGGVLVGFLGVVNQLWAREISVLPFSEGGAQPLVAPVETPLPSPSPSPLVEPIDQPEKLVIETLQLNADVELVGLAPDGRMDVPKADQNVAWYQLGAKPGEIGSAVIAGHYDSRTGGPAVFYELTEVQPGDEITVIGDGGERLTFVVTEVAKYKDSDFPVDKVFAQTDTRRLNLITCAGVFDSQQKNYSDRFVVFTQLVSEPPEISI